MAELADAQRSGRCMGDHVQVRILSGALLKAVDNGCFLYQKSKKRSAAVGRFFSLGYWPLTFNKIR